MKKVRFELPKLKKPEPTYFPSKPKGVEEKKSDSIKADNHVALIIAVSLAITLGIGTFFFGQDLKVTFFVVLVVFVVLYKYETIKRFFTKNMMRIFNT